MRLDADHETVWLTQRQMADLFDKDVRTVNEHLQSVFAECELESEATIRDFRIVRQKGSRQVTRAIEHCNLDVIGSVCDKRLLPQHPRREMKDTFRLYSDLAWLWPMWGDANTEYAHYCEHVAGLIRQYAERPAATLLDIGCGGGKNVLNLKRHFDVTGVDLSPVMLAQAKELNPECMFVEDDMRTFRLGRTFDAVLMDDAISHMTCLTDFVAAFRTAHAHLKPGGVLVATADVTPETFQQNRTSATPATRDGLDVVFVENVFDPDPTDEQYETTILYLIRERGHLRIETDHWTLGIFSLDTWKRVLRETGFAVHEGRYDSGEEEYTVFACVKEA